MQRDAIRPGGDSYARGGRGKLDRGVHHHTAEVYGEDEARRLRPWARRRVLALVGAPQ